MSSKSFGIIQTILKEVSREISQLSTQNSQMNYMQGNIVWKNLLQPTDTPVNKPLSPAEGTFKPVLNEDFSRQGSLSDQTPVGNSYDRRETGYSGADTDSYAKEPSSEGTLFEHTDRITLPEQDDPLQVERPETATGLTAGSGFKLPKLTRQALIQSVVMSEILASPRAYRPIRPIGARRG